MVGLWIDLRPDGMRVAEKWQTVAVTEAEAEWWKTWSMTGDNNWWLGGPWLDWEANTVSELWCLVHADDV